MKMKFSERDLLLKENLNYVNEILAENSFALDQATLPSMLKDTYLKESYFDALLAGYASSENMSEAAYAATGNTFANQFHASNVEVTRALMENAANELLFENAQSGGLRYYATLSFPLIKRYMIACTAKNVIPVEVPEKPIFKRGIERLFVYNPEKPEVKYELQDVFFNEAAMKDLNAAARKGMELEVELTNGTATVDLLDKIVADKKVSSISRDFKVIAVEAEVDGKTLVKPMNEGIVSGLNMIKIDINEKIVPTDKSDAKQLTAMVFGTLDYTTGRLCITTSNPTDVKKVKVQFSVSNEDNFRTVAFDWGHTEKEFAIPDGDHYNISIPVEYAHDAKALYGLDMQAKLTEICGTYIEHKKDKEIYDYLDKSFGTLVHPFGLQAKFDLKPSASFNGLPTEWSAVMFKKRLSQTCSLLKRALNIKDCYFAVVGNPFDIAELKGEIKWVYGDGQMSGIKLDYKFGLMEDDMHNYAVTSTERLPQGTIRIYLIPTNDEQMTYKHFQYAFYVSNAYSNPTNPLLPNVMISDRNMTDSLTPVQAQIEIINNSVDIITKDTDGMWA